MSTRELGHAEALQLLGDVALGRIAFTVDALPTIRPVNHAVDQDDVIVRGHRGVDVVLKAAASKVVAYSADAIDPRTYAGWSVTLTGVAQLVDNPAELARHPSIVRPWGTDEESYVIRIHPEVVTGFEVLEGVEELPAGVLG
jgi:nitroimidazol reductase NimA-like FMN-containing flavoprotein (pyridoxamine 5'-phosphate oxidase superfamily)